MSKPVQTIEFNIQNRIFTTKIFSISQPLPEEAEVLNDFFAIWNNEFVDGKLPSRKDIHFSKLIGWHSSLKLVDMGSNIQDTKKNLIIGEAYSEYWGKKTMADQIISMGEEGKPILKKYNECLKYLYSKHYNINIGVGPNSDGSIKKIMWIDLPLANDGENISHLLTGLIPLES